MRQLKSFIIILLMDIPFKKLITFPALLLILFISALSVSAHGRWNIYAGGSLSHLCEKTWYGNDKLNYGWGGGAFIGGGYEVEFTPHWSLTPQLELSYNDNGAHLHKENNTFYQNNMNWAEYLTLNIPVIASFRFPISDKIGLKFGTGPYLQEGLYGRRYKIGSDIKEKMSGSIDRRFNVGILGEAAVETGNHLSYMLRVQYAFLKEGWIRNTIVLSAGISYSF